MVNLSISGDSIVFEFINSNYYLQNGKIATPINSLALITDESNIATFKKASSNDIFVAATYDELGKSKNELIEWFKDNAVGATGGGGDLDDYYTKEQTDALLDEKASETDLQALESVVGGKLNTSDFNSYTAATETVINGKASQSDLTALETVVDTKADKTEIPDVSNYIDNVDYDSVNHLIKFFHNQTLIDSVDATDFIKDGMVSNVYIEGGNLVISFNTDAGKEDIEIPLTDIFNPNNYYDKTATDTLLNAKLNVSDFNTYSSATQTAIQGKASQTDLQALEVVVGTKANATDLDSLANVVNGKLNISDFNTYSGDVDTDITSIEGDIVDVQETLQGKVDNTAFDNYTAATATAINGKLAISDFDSYSSSTMTLIGNKASIDSVYDKTTIDTYTAATQTTLNGAVQHSEFDPYSSSTEMALSEKVRTTDFAQYTAATDAALQGKADASDLNDKVDVSTYTAYTAATDTALQGKADASDVYDTSTIDGMLADKADVSSLADYVDNLTFDSYTSATDTVLQGKADASDLNGKVDVSTYTAYTAATDTALNGKQATLVSGTNIKTINNTSLLGSGNIDIQGGGGQTVTSVTQAEYDALVVKDPDTFYIISDAQGGGIIIDDDLDDESPNAVANSAITIAIDAKVDTSTYNIYTAATNTAISTINTALGGYKLWKGTQAQYDAIVTKDEYTIYFIVNNS